MKYTRNYRKTPELIDEFLRDNDNGELTKSERGLLADWRKHYVQGRFIIMKHLVKHSVFLSFDEPETLYGVHGINDPIKETVWQIYVKRIRQSDWRNDSLIP